MKIIHILKKNEWVVKPNQKIFRPESLNQFGFIHCCFPDQLDFVVEKWFKSDELIVLEIETEKLKSDLRFEKTENQMAPFPHIYGPINMDAISAYYSYDGKLKTQN